MNQDVDENLLSGLKGNANSHALKPIATAGPAGRKRPPTPARLSSNLFNGITGKSRSLDMGPNSEMGTDVTVQSAS